MSKIKFDIATLVELYSKENKDEGRIYLYNNMDIFMNTMKIHDDDVMHDLYMKMDSWMHENYDTFDDERSCKQWMRFILNEAKRRLTDILRKRQKDIERYYDLPDIKDDEGYEMPDQGLREDMVVDEVDISYRKDLVRKAILNLPEEEMKIIAMMLDEYGYKQIDIARCWGVNFKHISETYKKALIKLRKELEGLQH